MKQKYYPVYSAFMAWMRRYWALIFFLLFFVTPIIFFMSYGASLGEAVKGTTMLTRYVGRRGFDFQSQYHSSEDIAVVVIILAILAFILFSLARYLYKSKK